MKNRYLVIKRLYPNYLILIKNKHYKDISLYKDANILKFIKYKRLHDLERRCINYLILNNLEIEKIKDYQNKNKYETFLLKSSIIKIIEMRLENEKENIYN